LKQRGEPLPYGIEDERHICIHYTSPLSTCIPQYVFAGRLPVIEDRNAPSFQLSQINKSLSLQSPVVFMPGTDHIIDPESLSPEERSSLRKQLQQILSDANEEGQIGPVTLRIEGESEAVVSLPEATVRPLLALLSNLAEGQAVSVADADEELTTREAADLLNVSRPHFTQLLKKGDIPSHKVGSHYRVYRRDVLAYKAKRRERSEEAMQKLTRLSQEFGLYD
jgi:excisionase family DNA binding protein